MLCNMGAQGWPVQYVSSIWVALTGIPATTAMGSGLWGIFTIPGACRSSPKPAGMASILHHAVWMRYQAWQCWMLGVVDKPLALCGVEPACWHAACVSYEAAPDLGTIPA